MCIRDSRGGSACRDVGVAPYPVPREFAAGVTAGNRQPPGRGLVVADVHVPEQPVLGLIRPDPPAGWGVAVAGGGAGVTTGRRRELGLVVCGMRDSVRPE